MGFAASYFLRNSSGKLSMEGDRSFHSVSQTCSFFFYRWFSLRYYYMIFRFNVKIEEDMFIGLHL